MDEKKISIVYSSGIFNLAEVNSSFDTAVLRIAYWGDNRNQTSISKAAFENAIPTMYYCPIVCNYDRDTDSIGGHDVDIVKGDAGAKMVNITTPVGVVPGPDVAKYFWETVEEADGNTHEYLCVPVLVWKRQEAYEHIRDNTITDESMEIRVLDGHSRDDGVFSIDKFEFNAFCLLERDRPCFESAGLKMFALETFKQMYAMMMDDFKREFAPGASADAEEDQEDRLKGGVDKMNLEEFTAENAPEVKDVDLSAMSQEPDEQSFADAACDAQSGEDGQTEPKMIDRAETQEDGTPEEPEAAETQSAEDAGNDEQQFAMMADQVAQALRTELERYTYVNNWGEEWFRYCYIDFDFDASEAYAWDMMDDNVYGFKFEMSGDAVKVDMDSKRRKKMVFVDFDFGDTEFSYHGVLKNAYATIESYRQELDGLRRFKSDIAAAERKAAEEEVFAKFDDLAGDDKFNELRENCADMTIEEIEDKCFAIRGRRVQVKFSANNARAIKLPVGPQADGKAGDEPYNGIFVKYNVGQK